MLNRRCITHARARKAGSLPAPRSADIPTGHRRRLYVSNETIKIVFDTRSLGAASIIIVWCYFAPPLSVGDESLFDLMHISVTQSKFSARPPTASLLQHRLFILPNV